MTEPVHRRGLLPLYSAASTLLQPVIPMLLNKRLARGKEHPQRIGERLGHASLPRPEGRLIWVHGASVGEMMSVLALVETLVQSATVLMTTGTVTSADLAQKRLPPGAFHQFVPIDTPASARRFIGHWRPDLAVFVESELWPNLIGTAKGSGSRLALVNGRMSARSARTWGRFPRTAGALLGAFDVCAAQGEADAARFRDLRRGDVAMFGNLKYDAAPLPVDAAALDDLRAAIGGRPVFVAASTHPGEDEVIIAAHLVAAARINGLLTIIAPRHPDRGETIATTAQAAGLVTARRATGAIPDAGTGIYVADTMGELGLFYRLAPFAFVGGSLVDKGGQNPIEPAKLGTGVLHGPHISNFPEIYPRFDAEGAALQVDEPDLLGMLIVSLLSDLSRTSAMQAAARTVAQSVSGATARTADALLALLERSPP